MASANFKVIPKRVTAESSSSYQLSPEQLQFYRDNGYLLIKKLIGIPALNSYRKRFTDICEGRVEMDRVVVIKDLGLAKPHVKAEDYINKIQELLFDDVFSTYSEDPRLLHIVTQLVGEDLTAINLMLINKPPGSGEHPPHQDHFYFPFRPADKILATWTAVDPVSRDNGCLYVVPGSHKTDVLYEHKEEVNATKLFFYGIVNSEEAAPEHSRVYFPMEPGDTVFFQSNIVHGSRPNVTKLYRKAITCHYANSSCHYIEPQGTPLEEMAKKVEAMVRRVATLVTLQRFTDVCEGRVEKGRVTVVKDRGLAKPHVKAEDYINKIQELLFDDVYSTYSEDPRLLHIVTQLIGEDLTAINLMLINKPPGTGEHPPHQDLLYFPFRPADKILATWTAIDPVNRDNGCLYMVPGSHKADVLYEHKEQVNASKLFFFGIVNSDEVAPEHSRVYLPMDPGDTVFFQSNIVHGSRPNDTQQYRIAMTCHYANSSCHYIEVYGTRQDEIAKQMEAELRRRGSDLSYVDMWRIKTKQVKGVRSNL